MSGETLLALAERCEKASGPDRELDAAIRCAVFAPAGAFVEQSPINGAWCVYEIGYGGKKRSWEGRGLSQLQRLGEVTASLDAAMTLVPAGWGWLVSQPNAKALASGLLKERTPVMGEVQYGCDQRFAVAAATPALALCAAALRARAHQETSNDG